MSSVDDIMAKAGPVSTTEVLRREREAAANAATTKALKREREAKENRQRPIPRASLDDKLANTEGLTPVGGDKAGREFKVDAAPNKLDIEFDEDLKPIEAPEAPEIPQEVPQAAQSEPTDAELLGVERKPVSPQEQHAQALNQLRSGLEQEAADIEVQVKTLQANQNLMDPAEFEQQQAFVQQAIAEHQRKALLYQGELQKQYRAAQQSYLTDLMREIPEWSNAQTRAQELQVLGDWLIGKQGMSREEFGNLSVAQVKAYRAQMKELAKSMRRKVKKVKMPKNDYDRMIDQKKRAQQAEPSDDFATRFRSRVKFFEDQGNPRALAQKMARRELKTI